MYVGVWRGEMCEIAVIALQVKMGVKKNRCAPFLLQT